MRLDDIVAMLVGWLSGRPRRRPVSAGYGSAYGRPARPALQPRVSQPVPRTPPASPVVDQRLGAAQARRKIFAAFNPAQPVEDRTELLGRSRELDELLRAMLDLHAHAVLYGARGAGKTSLVRGFGDHADERGYVVLYLSCGSGGSFSSIFAPYLADLPDACFAPDARDSAHAAIRALPPEFDARAFAAVLAHVTNRDLIFVVDEFDRVEDPVALGEIAALLKLLTDLRARVQMLFVGIAGNVNELIEAHPSLRRHLVAVPLGRFDPSGVDALFANGERRTSLLFTPTARQVIADMARGSPYHLRLFCFCAAMATVDAQSQTVGEREVEHGLRLALSMWSSTNARASRLFQSLARQSVPMRTTLARLATESLRGDPTAPPTLVAEHPDDPPLVQRQRASAMIALAPALKPVEEGVFIFDDALAPQLLLVTCRLAELDALHERTTAAKREALA